MDFSSYERWMETTTFGNISVYLRLQDEFQDPWNVYPMYVDNIFVGFYITDGYEIFDTVNERYTHLETGFSKTLDGEEVHTLNMWGEYTDMNFDLHANGDGEKSWMESRPHYEPFLVWKVWHDSEYEKTGRYLPVV